MCGKIRMYIANCNGALLSKELKDTSLFGYTLTYSFCVAQIATLRLILFTQRQFKATANLDIKPGRHTFPSSQVQLPSFQVRNHSNRNALPFCTCSTTCTTCMHIYMSVRSSTHINTCNTRLHTVSVLISVSILYPY